ncbi:MAG: response regulator transcription factor [Anaerolineales bacterium]|nr:response regulator transcription factor [Anaerolineales bacterium]
MTDQPIQVLLVDDHSMLRDGLRSLLEARDEIQVIGEAGTGREAVQITQEKKPDIVILDLGLPDINGLDVIELLIEKHPKVKIVVLSMHISREHVSKAIEAGAVGYIPKSSTHSSLLEAIQVVAQGESFLHPKATSALLNSITDPTSQEVRLKKLSEREIEVIRLTAMGLTSRESGLRLEISPKTVDTYRARAMEKLEIQQRSELIRFVLQAGLLDDIIEQ